MATTIPSVNVLSECPEWDLVLCLGNGHWTQADLEIFEGPDGQHHAHFYVGRREARRIWKDVKHIFVSYEVTSVSFQG